MKWSVDAALVALGGAAGTLARYGLDRSVGEVGSVPVSTLTVNIVGSFLIGVLLGRELPCRVRLFTATGVLGGFTTYSAFAVQSRELLGSHPVAAAAYAAGSVVAGVLAALAGLRWSRCRRSTP
ncbi:MAG: CrcB family protein [Aeromicrobium sp.]|uniref:fluoride efflux transporter FluC n=1 Tax=Aeromicrobium sp. TaxID=1871063 RepID=UPI0039E3DDFA